MNWDDPKARLLLSMRVGPEAYERARKAHAETSTIVTVNGHAIRPVQSRFGRLFQVGMTRRAFSTLAEAKAFAVKTP
jgi:hypothetical protein